MLSADMLPKPCYTAVLLLVSLCLVNGVPVKQHNIVRRAAAKTIGFVSTEFSECAGNCAGSVPRGLQSRSRVCRDQDGIRHPVCSPSVTEDCCFFDGNLAFFTNLVVACNPNCSLSGTPIFPVGSTSTTNPNPSPNTEFSSPSSQPSMSSSTVTSDGSTTTVQTFTIETDTGLTNTRQNIVGGTISFSGSIIPPNPQSFTVNTQLVAGGQTSSIFQINGADIVTIPTGINFVRITGANDTVEYESSTVSLSNPGVSVTITQAAPVFYYISPFGIAYQFNADKLSQETGEGVLFVDSGNTFAIFSQFTRASDLLLSNSINSYSVAPQAGNRLNIGIGTGFSLAASNIVEIANSGEPVELSNGNFISNGGSVQASLVFVFGSTGFEAFGNDSRTLSVTVSETYVSSPDAVFRDTAEGVVIVSTSPEFSQSLRQAISFVSDSNNILAALGEYNITGGYITFNGIELLNVFSSGVQKIDISNNAQILYSGNQLVFSNGTSIASNVQEVFSEESFSLNGGLGRLQFPLSATPGSALYLDSAEGKAVFLDSQRSSSIAFFDTAIDSAQNPVFPTASPSATFSLWREERSVFLRVDSQNVLEATSSSCQGVSITDGSSVSYSNGQLQVVQGNGDTTTFTGINMLTIAANGMNVLLLTSSTMGFSMNVDSSYSLTICGSNAVLTNANEVSTLISDASTLVSAGVTNGQRFLYVGSEVGLPLTADTIIFSASTNNVIRTRPGSVFTIADGANTLRNVNNGGNIFRYLQSDSSPVEIAAPTGTISGETGNLYFVDNVDAPSFFTDRTNVIDLLSNELATGFVIEMNNVNQTVLRRNGADIIVLNGIETVNVASDESLEYDEPNNRLQIIDSQGNVRRSFSLVNSFSTFLLGDSGSIETPLSTTISGPFTLNSQPSSRDFFATNNPILSDKLNNAIPAIVSQSVNATAGGNNNVNVRIGSFTFIVNDTELIPSDVSVLYDGSTLVFGSQGFPNINEYSIYLTSDFAPRTFNGSGPSVLGPGQIYTNGNRAFFTDRQDVTSAVNSISPVPPPVVSTRMTSDGRVVLVIGSQDIIPVNERPLVPVSGSQTVSYDGSTITITNDGGNEFTVIRQVISSFTSYTSSDTSPRNVPAGSDISDTPGTLVVSSDGRAFYTNRQDVQDVVNGGFSLVSEVNSNGTLVVGGESLINLNNSARFTVEDGQVAVISGSSIIIRDPNNGNATIRTIDGNDKIIRYLVSDSSPVSNPGNGTISGPVTIVFDVIERDALITNRPEVISSINTIIPGGSIIPSLPFETRPGDNDTTVFTINTVDIFTVDGGMIRNLSRFEEVTYDSSTAVITNFISGRDVANLPSAQIVRYLSTDSGPVTFTGSGPDILGPGSIFYQPNVAPTRFFVTDRQDISDFLTRTLADTELAATPGTATPQPGTTMDPVTVDIVNEDGSRWRPGEWSPCSRTCGVGVRVRNVVCRSSDGFPSTVCNQPGQRTFNAVPASVELCEIQDCSGDDPRNGVPRDETVVFTSFDTESYAVIKISDSNITDQVYTIDTQSLDERSGSLLNEKIENIDGVQSRVDNFMLRMSPEPLMTNVVKEGLKLMLQVNGETVFMVDPVRDSFPGDQCFEISVGDVVTYQDGRLSVTMGGQTVIFNDIDMLTTQEGPSSLSATSAPIAFINTYEEDLHSIDFSSFVNRAPFQISQASFVCVSPVMQSAFMGGLGELLSGTSDDGFINSVISNYNMIVDSLSAPSIMPPSSSSTPMEVISESGEVVQVGTPSVEVQEDIFYFSLRCQLSNLGNPRFTELIWRRDDGMVVPNNNVKFAITGDILLIKNINKKDEGNYTCMVSNPVGSNRATTEVLVMLDMPPTRPAVTPTTEPPPPDWVSGPLTECSEPCGVGFRARTVVCRDSSGEQSQECTEQTLPQLAEVCNTQDCPEGPARNGAPPVNTTMFVISIFNGDVEVRVEVTSSNDANGDYSATVTSVYPDETVITQIISDVGDSTTTSSDVEFGPEPLFGRLDSIRNGDRIDISNINLLFSVLPSLGDMCFNLSANDQFLYSDSRVLFNSEIFDGIQFVLGVQNEGIISFQESASRVFTGPLALVVSTAQRRAFYTDIPSLANTILMQCEGILDSFRRPMIMRVNDSEIEVVVDSPTMSTFASIGQTIRAPENAPLYISVRLSDSGNPVPSEVTWTRNGEPLEQDPDKGIFFTSGRYTLVINNLYKNIAGQYTATVRNPAGSDSVTSSIIIQPEEGIIVENRPSTPPVLDVGIGTRHNVDRNSFSSVRVFCDVATNDTDNLQIRFMVDDTVIASGDPNFMMADANSAILTQSLPSSGTITYTCVATIGENTTFTEDSVVNVMTLSPPTSVMFSGDTQLDVGQSSTITCTPVGGQPAPVAVFNEVRLGSDMIVSDFVFSDDKLMISKAVYGDDSQYCCEASNSVGRVLDCVSITLMIPPMIARPDNPEAVFVPLPESTQFPLQPPLPVFQSMVGQMVTAPRGSVVVIRCQVTGSPEPTISWFVNGVMSMEMSIGENFTIEGVQPGDAGTYECRANSVAGSDTLTTTLTVVSPPMVRMSSTDVSELSTPDTVVSVEQPSTLSVLDGLDFCLRCDFAPGVPAETTIIWQRNGDNINIRDACLSFAENRTQLCFEKISRPYSDRYSCRVSNVAGSDSGGIDVVVADPPNIAFPVHPAVPSAGFCDHQRDRSFVSEDVGVNLCVSPASDVLIDCVLTGNPTPTPVVQWIYNETREVLSSSISGITVFPNNSLFIDSIRGPQGVGGSGTYICRASNFAGSHERFSVLRASGDAPKIDTSSVGSPFQGNRYVTNVGSSRQVVTLQRFPEIQIHCSAMGSPTPQISWTVNGVDISLDADLFDIMDDGSLLITGLLVTECSQYVCTASNPLGQLSRSVTICGEAFGCDHSGFGPCSQTCGLGVRQPTFSCNRTFDGMTSSISSSLVLRSIIPSVEPTTCETGIQCPMRSFRFVASEFSECSKSCGCGRQSRTVHCFSFLGEQQMEEVDFDFCQYFAEDQMLPSPLSQICNDFPCPEWRTSDFSECSQECGFGGVQTRDVMCIAPANDNRTVEDSFCDANGRPSSSRSCNRIHCPYQYTYDPWSACSTTCLGGIRTRRVFCYDATRKQEINDTLCVRELGEERRPISTHICGVGDCSGHFAWRTGDYNDCSVTCGNGVQTRSVDCVMTMSGDVVSDTMCIARNKPSGTRSCFPMACPSGDCVGENSICGIFAAMGLCSLVQPNCCLSCRT